MGHQCMSDGLAQQRLAIGRCPSPLCCGSTRINAYAHLAHFPARPSSTSCLSPVPCCTRQRRQTSVRAAVAASSAVPWVAPEQQVRNRRRGSAAARQHPQPPYHTPQHQRCATRRSRTGLTCRAISLPDTVDSTLRNLVTISAVAGIGYAVLLAAVTPPPPAPGARGRPALGAGAAGGGADADNFAWGLMGFISCLPIFNWLAWVLAAISDEDRAALYGTYAALYGTPLLLRGLDWQDPWVLLLLLLCAVHVQAERIAQTEPETLRSIRPVGAVGAALRGVVGGTGAFLSGLGGVLAEDSRRVVRRPGASSSSSRSSSGRPAELGSGDDRLQLGEDLDPDLVQPGRQQDPRRDASRDPELEDYSARELRQFDEQLRAAEQQRRANDRGGGGAGSS